MNIESTILDRDLRDLRDELAHSAAPASGGAWGRILFASRVARTVDAETAEGELARVHVMEVARLLRQAALLRCAAGASTPLHAREPELASWRTRARAELAQWRVDGIESPAILRACAARPISRWDAACVLAGAACALDPGDAARLCVAYVERVVARRGDES